MMKRTFSRAALCVLLLGAGIVGCANEDYADLDKEYSTMNDALATKYADAEKGFSEMSTELGTVTVADDWDDAHRTSFDAARTQMDTYNAKLQEGKQKMEQWKTDLEAAKKEGREAYQARLNEARTWYNEYTAWLDQLNNDIVRYREARAAEGSDPWWVTVYTVNASGTTTAATGDDDGKMAKEADDSDDDEGGVKQAAKDVKQAAVDVGDKVKEGFRKITNDSDDD